MGRQYPQPLAIAAAVFVGTAVLAGGGYWLAADWTEYIDDGLGGRRPFDRWAPEGQAIVSGFVGVLAGWAAVAALACGGVFWFRLERGGHAEPAAAADSRGQTGFPE